MDKKGLQIIDGNGEGTGKPSPITKLLIQTVVGTPQTRIESTSEPVRLSIGMTLEEFDPTIDPRLHKIRVIIGSRVGELVCLGRERGKLLWETVEAGDEVKTTSHGRVIGILQNPRPRKLSPLTEDEIPVPGETLQGFNPELSPFEQVPEIRGKAVIAKTLSWEAILWEDTKGQLTFTTDLEGRVKIGFADIQTHSSH